MKSSGNIYLEMNNCSTVQGLVVKRLPSIEDYGSWHCWEVRQVFKRRIPEYDQEKDLSKYSWEKHIIKSEKRVWGKKEYKNLYNSEQRLTECSLKTKKNDAEVKVRLGSYLEVLWSTEDLQQGDGRE